MPQKRKKHVPQEAFDVEPLLKACGTTLRTARKAQGLKQVEISKRIGLAQSSISMMEDGEQCILLPSLLHWSHVLQTPMGVLFPADPTTSLARVMRQLAACPPFVHEAVSAWLTGWAQVTPEMLTAMLPVPAIPSCPEGSADSG